MTTIVAAKGSNGVIFGSDSQVSGDLGYDTLAAPKVFKNGPYVIGVAGLLPALQAVQFADLPEPEEGLGNYDRFVRTVLIPAIRKMEDTEGLEHGKSIYLMSFCDQIYIVSGENYFLNSTHSFNAIGSGGQYARAYLIGLNRSVYTEEDVLDSLRVAAGVDNKSSGPFHIQKATK